jgi:hypothetical protein
MTRRLALNIRLAHEKAPAQPAPPTGSRLPDMKNAMTNSSSLAVGDWVEVRPLGEILRTLDNTNCLVGLPFMPEMAKYCGRRFRIVKLAHKTCDPTGRSNLRRMEHAVHLDTRCDGSGHDGCEARCLIIWKTDWLKLAEADTPPEPPAPTPEDIARLQAATKADAKRYRCQLTELVAASTNLPSSNIRQYVEDLTSGNVAPWLFFKTVSLALVKEAASRILGPLTRYAVERFMPHPPEQPAETETEVLDLQPGELVQIRPEHEILATLDKDWKHRGLAVEREMFRYCDRTFRVSHHITKTISEHTGKMINFKNRCVVLDGVACQGLDNRSRLFCQRAPFYYWRESWLRRAGDAS